MTEATGVIVTRCCIRRSIWWRSRTTGVDSAITAAVAAIKWDGVRAVNVASARVPWPGGPAHSSTVVRSEP